MSKPQQIGDPSMDDILASIRRIIAEDPVQAQAQLPPLDSPEFVSPAPVHRPAASAPDSTAVGSQRRAEPVLPGPVQVSGRPTARDDAGPAKARPTRTLGEALAEGDDLLSDLIDDAVPGGQVRQRGVPTGGRVTLGQGETRSVGAAPANARSEASQPSSARRPIGGGEAAAKAAGTITAKATDEVAEGIQRLRSALEAAQGHRPGEPAGAAQVAPSPRASIEAAPEGKPAARSPAAATAADDPEWMDRIASERAERQARRAARLARLAEAEVAVAGTATTQRASGSSAGVEPAAEPVAAPPTVWPGTGLPTGAMEREPRPAWETSFSAGLAKSAALPASTVDEAALLPGYPDAAALPSVVSAAAQLMGTRSPLLDGLAVSTSPASSLPLPTTALPAEEVQPAMEPTGIVPAQPPHGETSRSVPMSSLAQPSQTGANGQSAVARSLEDTVAELLRPMLREWLDTNMARIVEKALHVELAPSQKGQDERKPH